VVDDVFAGLPRGIWDDDNARWLLKVNEAGGELYFNKELHQQMLWWMQLPDLLAAKAPAPAKSAKSALKSTLKSIGAIEQTVEEACEQAEESGYRIEKKKESTAKPAKAKKEALAK
jgi:hypothetical protein